MNILHLCDTPLSGSPYRLMSIQRKMGHNARLINTRVRYSEHSNIYYPEDIVLENDPKTNQPKFDMNEISELFEHADIIHCHNFLKEQFIFRFRPRLKEFLKKAHVVLQVHSPRASIKNISKNLKDPDVNTKLVVAQFQARQFPECIPVPNAIDIFEPPYVNIDRQKIPGELPRIVYSPSNKHLKGWNNKGYLAVTKVLNTFKYMANTEIITNTPHLECISRRQLGDICIDEFMTGSYHLCTLEGLSHGQVVFCNLDARTQRAIAEICHEPLPVINTTEAKFSDDLFKLLQRPERIKQLGKDARAFMERNWRPEDINYKYLKAYDN